MSDQAVNLTVLGASLSIPPHNRLELPGPGHLFPVGSKPYTMNQACGGCLMPLPWLCGPLRRSLPFGSKS